MHDALDALGELVFDPELDAWQQRGEDPTALPQTQADILDTNDQDLVLLSLTKDRKIYIGKTEIPREKLETILEFNEKLKKDKKIDFAADRSLDYGFVVDVMAALRRAGIEQVGMLTEPPPPDKE